MGVSLATGNVTIEDAWITDVTEQTYNDVSPGAISHQGTGTLTLRGAVIQDVVHAGIGSQNYGGPTILEDVVIRRVAVDTNTESGGSYAGTDSGFGLQVFSFSGYTVADLSASRIVIEDTDGDGIGLGIGLYGQYSNYASADISDVVLRANGTWRGFPGSSFTGTITGGSGISVVGDTTATISRAIIEDESRSGIFVGPSSVSLGAGSTVDASDVYISGAGAAVDDYTAPGQGFTVDPTGTNSSTYAGAPTITATRMVVDGAHTYGIDVQDADAATFEDVVVQNTEPHSYWGMGIPVRVSTATMADVALHRVQIDGGYGAGIALQLVAADLQDVSVAGIESLEEDGRGGFGLESKYSDVTVERASVTDVAYAGIWLNSGISSLTDVLVSGVSQQACVTGKCPKDTAATGVFVGADPGNDVEATLSVVVIEDAMGVGLQNPAGMTTATDVLVRNNAVGLDTIGGTLMDTRVELSGNTVDMASTAEPAPTLPWGVEVPNPYAAGKSFGKVLDEGTYSLYTWTSGSSTCGSLPYYYYPQQYVGLQWQGGTEFTVGRSGDLVPSACVYDGKAVSCTGYTIERAINETSILTTTVEHTGFNINSTTSFGWAEQVTIDCAGDWCSLAIFPCTMDVGMRYDKL